MSHITHLFPVVSRASLNVTLLFGKIWSHPGSVGWLGSSLITLLQFSTFLLLFVLASPNPWSSTLARSNLIKGRGMVMQLNYESSDFHDLHCSAMSLSKRSSHCKPRCQTSWNNIFARIGNGVISPIGSKTFEAMLNRLLLVSGSLAVSTLAGTLKMKQSVNVFQQIPSAFSGSLALKSMVLDSACSCSAMWLRTSFELVAHLD